MSEPSLSMQDALRAVGQALNTLSLVALAPLLDDELLYEVQWHHHEESDVWLPFEIYGKAPFVEHMTVRFNARADANKPLFAELGTLPTGPCLVLADGSKDELVATVLVDVVGDKIRHLAFCLTPAPSSVARTGEYPG